MLMLVFALPEEARVVRRRIRWGTRMEPPSRGVFAGQEVSLSFAGLGGTRITEVERAVELIKPRMIISSGFAGATQSSVEAGDFVLSTNYTDPEIGKVLSQQKLVDAAGVFVQVSQVASVSDKWALSRSAGSIAVDMESEAIAELCRRHQTRVISVRMISDSINESIPAIFSKRKFSGLKDLGDAAVFAARMLRLTGKLADRLETLVGAVGE